MAQHHKNEEFVIHQHAKGGPEDHKDIWQLQETPFPHLDIQDNIIGEPLFLTVDPFIVGQVKGGKPIGSVQDSFGVVRVFQSHNPAWPVGTVFYFQQVPWRRYSLFPVKALEQHAKVWKRPGEENTVLDKLGFDAALNGLGMTAQTAYYGAVEKGKYKPTDVLVISGAAGAVGLFVGQIAKNVQKVKKVIGIAGGKEKTERLVKELGFDAAVDYKEYNTKEKMAAKLKEVAGEPITAYYDNTGGFVTDAVFSILGTRARVVICGNISSYHETLSYPNYLAQITYREIDIFGLYVGLHGVQNETEFYPDVSKWLLEHKIKTPQTTLEGFDQLPRAYERMVRGEDIGKIIVKV